MNSFAPVIDLMPLLYPGRLLMGNRLDLLRRDKLPSGIASERLAYC